MGHVPSQYIAQYQGLSVPTDDRLPWNPWSGKDFQFQENKNFGTWQPWQYSCFENRNDENRRSSQLFVDSGCFSSATGSLGEIQTKTGVWGNHQSTIFQNTFNDNREKHFQKSNLPMDGFSRKTNRKSRKCFRPRRVLKQIATDTTANSSLESPQQSYKNWNHDPFFGWEQSNLPSRPAAMCFRNIALRSRAFNEYSKNGRSRNSARSKFNARNVSGNTAKATASRAHFNSDNYSTKNMGNAAFLTSDAKCLSGTNMAGKGNPVNSATSNNSGNFKEDDDVMYLFSVDSSSEGKMFLEIDLQSDGVNLLPNKDAPNAEKTKKEDDQPIIIAEELDFNKPQTRKRKFSESNDKARKRPSHRPRCAACKKSYDEVTANKLNMFISSTCSHVFCGSCISKDKESKVCPACEIKFIGFRRLYI